MRRPLTTALLVVGCALAGTARATDAVSCRNGSFPTQETAFGLAKVVGAARISVRHAAMP